MCLFFSFPHRLPRDGSEQTEDFSDGAHSWMDDIHVFTVIRKEDLTTKTMDEMWDILAWDMEGMLEGVFPTERHDGEAFRATDKYLKAVQGQSIAGGARFAIIQLKQDWEHISSV